MKPQFGALQGVRVLDFSHMIAGPLITLLMAYNGAEVIKVESKQRMDGFRHRRGDEEVNASRPFGDFNRNKLDVTINLKSPEGCALAKRLAAVSDVVVENFSASVMAKLGLSYDELRAVRPDLVMVSTQGMGQSGPYKDFVAWGPSAMAFSGMTALWNHAGAEDVTGSQTAHPDYITAHALVAVLAALRHRARTGQGQYVELAQSEAAACLLGPAFLEWSVNGNEPRPRGNGRSDAAPHGAYRCAGEDDWCAIAVRSDAEWQAFSRVTGIPDDERFGTLLGRLRNREALDRLVDAWTGGLDKHDAVRRLQAAGVPAAVVASGRDLCEDEHLRARGFLVEVDHPLMGRKTYAGVPGRLSDTPPAIWRHAPLLGQDNDYVFGQLLGMPECERQELAARGVIA
jgi:benzylsuccinate CoA-transferase BbsF subunit